MNRLGPRGASRPGARWLATLGAVLAVAVATMPAGPAAGADGVRWAANRSDRVAPRSLPAAVTTHAIIRSITLPSDGRTVGVGSQVGDPIYIAAGDGFGGQLLRIDPVTLALTGSVHVGNYPKGIAVSGDDTVYVVNADSNTMSVVRGSTMTVSKTVSVPTEPQAVALSKRATDDTVFVTSKSFFSSSQRKITTLNARNLDDSQDTVLPGGASPWGLAISSDDTAHIAVFDNNFIYRFNSTTRVVSTSFSGGQGPIGVAITDSDMIYFSRETGNMVTRYPANSPWLAQSIFVTDPQGIAISADDTVYVAGRSSKLISVIDPVTFAVDDSVAVSGQPQAVAVTRSGLVVTANSGGPTAWIIGDVTPSLVTTSAFAGATGSLTLGGCQPV